MSLGRADGCIHTEPVGCIGWVWVCSGGWRGVAGCGEVPQVVVAASALGPHGPVAQRLCCGAGSLLHVCGYPAVHQ